MVTWQKVYRKIYCWMLVWEIYIITIIVSNIFTSGIAKSKNMVFYDHEWNKFYSYTKDLTNFLFLLD